MGSISFYLTKKHLGGRRPVSLCINHKGIQHRVSTSLACPLDCWDEQKQLAKRTHPNAATLNSKLSEIRMRAERLLSIAELENRHITRRDLEQILVGGQKARTVESLFSEFVEKKSHARFHTIKNYKAAMKAVAAYQGARFPQLLMTEITPDWLMGFERFLNETLKNNNQTTAKKIKCLKVFLNWCDANNYFDMRNIRNMRLRGSGQVDRVALSEEQLQLYHIPYPFPHLERAAHLFLFMCWTGLRYSDVVHLQPESIVKEGDMVYLNIVTIKTSTLVKLPLLPEAVRILGLYDNLLPVISNQKMNEYIKECSRLAGLTQMSKVVQHIGSRRTEKNVPLYKRITCHTARRTFITLSRKRGIRAEVIQKMVGHANIAQTLQYSQADDADLRNEFLAGWAK